MLAYCTIHICIFTKFYVKMLEQCFIVEFTFQGKSLLLIWRAPTTRRVYIRRRVVYENIQRVIFSAYLVSCWWREVVSALVSFVSQSSWCSRRLNNILSLCKRRNIEYCTIWNTCKNNYTSCRRIREEFSSKNNAKLAKEQKCRDKIIEHRDVITFEVGFVSWFIELIEGVFYVVICSMTVMYFNSF